MSEKDMKLGGAAATKFASKSSVYASEGSGTVTYQTSDQVRAFYNKKEERELEKQDSAVPQLPPGWEQRQKKLAVEAKQHGAFARNQPDPLAAAKSEPTSAEAEIALLQVTTFSLEALAKTLEANSTAAAKLPMEERTAFANAVKRVMSAMAKSSI